MLADTGIDLDVVGQAGAVGDIAVGAQARAVDGVERDAGLAEAIGDAGRARRRLVVVDIDEMVGDIGQVVGREVELRRHQVHALGLGDGQVGIGGQRTVGIVERELGAAVAAIVIIERRQDDRRAELALVDQVPRDAFIAVDADGEVVAELLLDAQVVIVVALGIGQVVLAGNIE